MIATPAQARLIGLLMGRVTADADEAAGRWAENASLAQEYGLQKRLLLARDWTADLVLDVSGEVYVVDTEYGGGQRVAGETERKTALFRSIRRYPELLSLLPTRTPESTTCGQCEGIGVLAATLTNDALRNVVCECGGAGWI